MDDGLSLFIQGLIHKKRTGSLSALEDAVLREWESSHPDDQLQLDEKHRNNINALKKSMYGNILTGIGQPVYTKTTTKRYRLIKYAVAASLLIGTSITIFLYPRDNPSRTVIATKVTPGRNQAILTLANGHQISLMEVNAGKLAVQAQTTVTKTENGRLVYHEGTIASGAMQYNMLTTPRGGQWPEVVLPDGTRVMLDAASSIRYPVKFTGIERVVELTGQAYFRVAHNAKQPFRIKVAGTAIEDIGTSFNVEAYPEEDAIKTTLVDGSVRLVTTADAAILKPGYQGTVARKGKAIEVEKVNLNEATAWMNGQTSFQGKTVEEIMSQVSRWYDVDVVYIGGSSGRRFTGGISRRVQLADLIRVLEFQDLHLELKGKQILVRAK